MRDAIDAVNWHAVPGRPGWYEPDRVRHGLHVLAGAANRVRAAEAGALLGGGGIVHGHSGAVFPAAAVATPLLLDIAEHGHPAARDTALGLVDEALSSWPHAGYTRLSTPDGMSVPLCCAVAHGIRTRTDFLVGLGKRGRALLADAAEHWRFEIQECVAEGDDTAAFGVLSGSFAEGAHPAELHRRGEPTGPAEVALIYPPTAGSPEACLRLKGRHPGELPPGTFLLPARCGERVH